MSPRFKRYFLRALPRFALLMALTLAVNLLGHTLGVGWLRADPWLAVVVFAAVFGLNWLTRTDPQRRD